MRIVCALIASVAFAGAHASESALTNHLTAMSATLGARERLALAQIPEIDRRLLALRAYVRARPDLDERWSWTEQEIRSYERSSEYQLLLADLERVRREFARRHPGHTLYANTQVRSLDVQLGRWNTNDGVGRTGASLLRAARATLMNAPEQPNRSSIASFERFLTSWRPAPAAPLAAPGLSAHGRMRAVDFLIVSDGRIVAATELAAVARDWDGPGWSRKLADAIAASGANFVGPLRSPYEPWHYEYQGASAKPAPARAAN